MEDTSDSLGPCCICETTAGVRNIVLLDRRSPMSGHGWGCIVCSLPADGAVAVLCDPCFAAFNKTGRPLRFVCRGYPATEGRLLYAELPTERFEHDMARHATEDERMGGLPRFSPTQGEWQRL